MCKAKPPSCRPQQSFNKNTCQCTCAKVCPSSQPLNRTKCVCECTESPNKCFLKGRRFHPATCRWERVCCYLSDVKWLSFQILRECHTSLPLETHTIGWVHVAVLLVLPHFNIEITLTGQPLQFLLILVIILIFKYNLLKSFPILIWLYQQKFTHCYIWNKQKAGRENKCLAS